MPRKKKQDIKVNNSTSLESLMQETYNDACGQLLDAQKTINEMTNAADPEDVGDLSTIARERSNALKIKDSAIKIKLEIAKLQNDILKHNGDIEKGVESHSSGQASAEDFDKIREMIEKGKKSNEEGYTLD
jgi:hypothetical protein